MKITSSIEYATRLMVTLAREYGKAPYPAERLAGAENIPADYVSQLLVKLRRAGLVVSHRGSAGGYVLSRGPEEITLGQVARAVDGDIFEDVCEKYDGGDKDCHHQDRCSISPVWRRLGELITGYFESVTLAAILEEKAGACGAAPAWLEKISSGK
jgi:Rrf2 family protein